MASEPEPDLTDPENPEWTEEMFARARPAAEVLPPALMEALTAKRRGRPALAHPKRQIALRVDADVLEAWRASGPGWQSRMNEALRAAMPQA